MWRISARAGSGGGENTRVGGQRSREAGVTGCDSGLAHARQGKLRMSVSVGYACFPDEGRDCAGLLACADSRMYGDRTDRKPGKMAERSETQSVEETLILADDALGMQIAA